MLKYLNIVFIRKVFLFTILGLISSFAAAQPGKEKWVDSVMQRLTVSDKISQMFMLSLRADDIEGMDRIQNEIKSHEIGGLILQKFGPTQQVRMINSFQKMSPLPLLVGMEAAFGLGLGMDSTITFPPPIVLGALPGDSLLYTLGAHIGQQLNTVGVQMNFSPFKKLQVANDTATRLLSYGERPVPVALKAVALMKGMESRGILSCARNFEVSGIRILDVEKGLPVVEPSVDSIQIFPYQKLFENGLHAVIPASRSFPLFYEKNRFARRNKFNSAALTSLFTGDWIKKNLHYRGLVFVEIPKVEIITEKYRAGEAELFAFQAGNDVMIEPKDIGPAIRKIRKLVRSEKAYAAQLDETVRKILAAKYDAGLSKWEPLYTDNLSLRLNSPESKVLKQQIYNQAVTLVRNPDGLLPIRQLEDKKIAFIPTGVTPNDSLFHSIIVRYTQIDKIPVYEKSDVRALEQIILDYSLVVVTVPPSSRLSVINKIRDLLPLIKGRVGVVFVDYGNDLFANALPSAAIINAYTDTPEAARAAAHLLFGSIPAMGKLPYSMADNAPAGSGLSTMPLGRLMYTLPEEADMDSQILRQIDDIAKEAIDTRATPGCQVLVARKGKVVFEKSYGYLTYDKKLPVNSSTIYDLASVTKVMATLQTAMFLYDHGLMDLNRKVSFYLPELRKTNKRDITVIDMLTHQAGLLPFIPMWPETVKDTVFLPLYYHRTKSSDYPLQVASNLYATQAIRDSVWSWILRSDMSEKPPRTPYGYRYSDLGFLILQRLSEKILNQPMDAFLTQNLYDPLGANSTGFNPLEKFNVRNIAPTEDDRIFRKSFVAGTVHDERAAMMGGVAGHAGLFSNANDLAKVGQMLLQDGYYGGVRYYKPQTVRYFTQKAFRLSRRGIGWDKPIINDPNSPTSEYASPLTFGHTGFTGTCIWIDPAFDLVYIFLSNRVYPDRSNKLSNTNIRSRIQDVIYKSIFTYQGCKESGEQVGALQ